MALTLRGNRGLTLVEVVVSGALGAIIAAVILTVFSMQGSAYNENLASAQLQMQANSISEEIGRRARSGNLVLEDGETWSASFPTASPLPSAQFVRIYDASGVQTAAFRISGTTLEESTSVTTWRPYFSAGRSIDIASGSGFSLCAERKNLTINLNLTTVMRGRSYSFALRGDTYRCRN